MTNSGHLRTPFFDEIQAEDRQSRPSPDIAITFLAPDFFEEGTHRETNLKVDS